MSDPTLTHLDSQGHAHMVHVGGKTLTDRAATAEGWVRLSAVAFRAVCEGEVPKGDVMAVARIAGIQGAKRTADLIPLCHPLPLDGVSVELRPTQGRIRVRATARTHWKTGVEMEALTAVSAACLAVYDMCKALDKEICIEGVRLLDKRGGRSGDWRAADVDLDAEDG